MNYGFENSGLHIHTFACTDLLLPVRHSEGLFTSQCKGVANELDLLLFLLLLTYGRHPQLVLSKGGINSSSSRSCLLYSVPVASHYPTAATALKMFQPSQMRWSSFINQDSTTTADLWPPNRSETHHGTVAQRTLHLSSSNSTSDWESISTFTGQEPQVQQQLVRDSIRSLKAFVEREIGLSALRTSEVISESTTLVGSPVTDDSVKQVSYTHLAKAKYSYNGTDEDENKVSFRRDEVLQVEATSELWWRVKKANGETGVAPATYLAVFPDAEFSSEAEYKTNTYSLSSMFSRLLGSATKLKQRLEDADKVRLMLKGLSAKMKKIRPRHQVVQEGVYDET